MKIRFIYILSVLFGLSIINTFAQNDTTLVMDFDAYMKIVKEHHPISQQAELQLDRGKAVLREARGGFDPKINLESSQKDFEDKNYYDLLDAGLKVPTWFGLEFNGGYEQTRGVFLNPENKTPGAGLVYAGVGIPIGEGLFIDKRRAELRKAKIFRESTEAMRKSIYNGLLFDAGQAYWEWFMAYHVLLVYENALNVAIQRFEAVKQSALLGDKPSIDTLESGIQVQNRRLALQQSRLDFKNTSALLSIYLWREGEIPLELDSMVVPQEKDRVETDARSGFSEIEIDSLLLNHPDLLQYDFKIEQLDIERRWKIEQLKPDLNLKYNFLAEPLTNNIISEFTPNNYKWGLQFEMPVLLRKERGALLQTKVKVQEAQFDYSLKQAELGFKFQAARNELVTTNSQVNLYRQTVRDYQGLLSGERTKFSGGESSLFLVNSRELGYINAQIKLIELLSKNQKAKLKRDYALGILSDINY
ncbi:MAG: TolC family protein [Cytophagales bacterium]